MRGCPGLQFRLGNKLLLFPVCLLIWIFCVPLSVIVPAIFGLFFGLIMPYKVLYDVFNNYKRASRSRRICGLDVNCLSVLLMAIFVLMFFGILTCISVAVCELIASVISISFLIIVCPVCLVFIPYFLLRITLMSCRTLK